MSGEGPGLQDASADEARACVPRSTRAASLASRIRSRHHKTECRMYRTMTLCLTDLNSRRVHQSAPGPLECHSEGRVRKVSWICCERRQRADPGGGDVWPGVEAVPHRFGGIGYRLVCPVPEM